MQLNKIMMKKSSKAVFRFYEELNDYLPEEKKKVFFAYNFKGSPSVRDVIESIGIPHAEIDLILANSKSVEFSYSLKDGDIVSIYPVFETLDISNVTHLRKKPLREPKFILNSHLEKLTGYLQKIGFDTFYRECYKNNEIIKIAVREGRIILTQNPKILKNREFTHGYFIRSKSPEKQLNEVIDYFDLYSKISLFPDKNLSIRENQ